MKTDSIADNIKGRISEILGENVEQIHGDTPLDSLGLDSFRLVEILIFVEREYGLNLMSRNLQKEDIQSVNSLAATIQKHLAE